MSLENLLLPLEQLHLDAVELNGLVITIVASSVRPRSCCPSCHMENERVHSRYRRTVSDLPWADRRLILHLHARRFFCDLASCPRRTFAERFGPSLPPYARRTARLTVNLSALAFAAGGHGAARLAHLLTMPISPRTALRIMHRQPLPPPPAPRVVGLDDWAWKKGRTYGSICVDLERHQPIDLLPDREPATIAAWLQAHPTIEVVARDRGGAFIDGVRQGAPEAIQVADRWHLLKNLGDALEQLFHHQSSVLKQVFAELEAQPDTDGPQERTIPTLDGASVSQRSKASSAAWSTRAFERYHEVHTLHTQKIGVATIARLLHLSRPTVYRYLQMREPPTPSKIAVRERHVVDPWKPYLVQQWNAGCRNALLLWRDIRDNHGYTHSPRTVARFVEVLRRDSGTPRSFRTVAPQPVYAVDTEQKRPLTALQAQRLWRSDPEQRSVWLERYRLAVCERDTGLAHAYTLTQSFCEMVRERTGDKLDDWLAEVHASEVAQLIGFAKGLERDYAAVKAGLTLEWSNGQTEAQVHRLKLLKRQMYGQAGFDLLRQRVLHRDPPAPVYRHSAQEHAKAGHQTDTHKLLGEGSFVVNRPSERSFSRKVA